MLSHPPFVTARYEAVSSWQPGACFGKERLAKTVEKQAGCRLPAPTVTARHEAVSSWLPGDCFGKVRLAKTVGCLAWKIARLPFGYSWQVFPQPAGLSCTEAGL